jgi:hypothetical protein
MEYLLHRHGDLDVSFAAGVVHSVILATTV